MQGWGIPPIFIVSTLNYWTRPTGPDGGSYVISSVSLSVRQSVSLSVPKVVILREVSGHFLAQNALVFGDFAYHDYDIYHLMVVKVLEKIAGPEKGLILALIEP